MEIKRIGDEIRVKLREKFPDEAYSQHPTKTFLTTLKAMYVTERLNDVFGIGRWTLEHEVIAHENDYVLMKGRLVLADYDCLIPEQYGGHGTAGKNTEVADGFKSAITDIISKSASYLEIGIDMFKGHANPLNGGSNSNNDKYKFGSAKDESLPWVSDDKVKAMEKAISDGKKQDVINSLVKYKWSKKNKELITNELNK